MSKSIVYIGTYTSGKSEGIYIYNFDTNTGKLEKLGAAPKIENPSYIITDSSNSYLYSVIETEKFNDRNGGAVAAFSIDKNDGKLNLLNIQSTNGKAPCHLCLDSDEKYLYVANYSEGTVSVFPLNEDGSIAPLSQVIRHEGKGPDKERQEMPHVHFVRFTPDEKYLCAVDLGIDKVMIYAVNRADGSLVQTENLYLDMKAGSGPRHMEFHQEGKYLYVINELDSSVTVLKYFGESYSFQEVQTISTLPVEYSGTNTAAAIAISTDGNFLYATNRGDDSIAAYRIDKSTGILTLIGHYSSEGKCPRDLKIHSSGKYLCVANQNSDTVVSYEISRSGELRLLEVMNVPNPVCIKFAQL